MTSLERTLTLTVPSATENLALIRDFVVNVGSQAGLGDDDVAKLGRAGFPYRVACEVIDAEDADALERRAEGRDPG